MRPSWGTEAAWTPVRSQHIAGLSEAVAAARWGAVPPMVARFRIGESFRSALSLLLNNCAMERLIENAWKTDKTAL